MTPSSSQKLSLCPHTDLTRHHFDLLAESFDQYSLRRATYLQSVEQAILTRLDSRKPRTLIDVGCGTGYRTLSLMRHLKIAYCLGVDFSPRMSEIAGDRLRSHGGEVICGDIQTLVLPEKSFDCGVCLFNTLGYISGRERRQRVLAKIAQTIRPDGILFLDLLNRFCLVYDRTIICLRNFLSREFSNIVLSREWGDFFYSVTIPPDQTALAYCHGFNFREAICLVEGARLRLDHIGYIDYQKGGPTPSFTKGHIFIACFPQD